MNLDNGTVAELYRMHGQALLSYLRRRAIVDSHLAEDIVQETFLRAWRNPAVVKNKPEAYRAWLMTVARNLLIDALRHRARHPRETGDGELTGIPLPGTDIQRSTDALSLRQAIRNLTPRQREVIAEIFIMQRTHPEVAEVLGIPLGTVKSRASGALCALRRELAALRPEDQLELAG
ncbi:RNA polymerase sigma factor SigL [Lentzea sp. NBRC 105346]|uniref:sigma-70 family RNA polymerase sigma factor n=1 Tax=Lentzea sp. NBRC 105346 TaxID=3032205 RepID=UPI0024A33B32|nr:sigma-70 family RNA polymerase sigma factor [Lentzea sp. NBRC 105346]GLZ29191.1 RNA polymerase sigma factor SigL [Lentzea sp. NBRC 105346]